MIIQMYSIKEVKEKLLHRMHIIANYDSFNESGKELKPQGDVESLAKAYYILTEAEAMEKGNEGDNSDNG